MADRDAKVRLNLAANGFLTQLQQLQAAAKEFEKAVEGVGDGGEKTARKLGAFGNAAKAGLGAAQKSLSELGSSLKSTLTQVATLGGALSFASAARGAVELQASYKDLAFAIQAGTGEAVNWRTVQKQIEGTAGRWKQSNEDVAASYRALWEDIGDAKFAGAAVESVARASTATGASMRGLSTIAGQLREKFDIPTEGLDDALASVIALGNKGGASVEDLGEKIGILGASAKEAGYGGAGGLQKMLAMLNMADNVTGNFRKSLKSVTGVLDTLGDPEKIKNISKELHLELVNPKTKKPFEHALEMIIAKSGGKQEVLAKVFSGDELKLVSDFGKTYAKAFDSTTGDLKTKMTAGLSAYKSALDEAGKQTLSAADVDKEASTRLDEPKRKLADALNKLENAFATPTLIDGLNKLADVAPRVADALGKLLGFAAEHPKTAVAAVVGAKVGSAVLPAVAGSLLSAGGKGLWKMAAKMFGRSAATAAAGAEGAGAAEAAGAAGAAGGGAGVGAAALAALPVAITAAGALYTGHKINQRMDTKNADLLALSGSTEGARLAMMGGSDDQKRSAAKELRARLAESRKTGHSALDDIFGGVARTISGTADPNKQARGKAEQQLSALEKSLNKGSASGDRVAAVLNRVADSAERMNAVFDKFGGPEGSNGLPPSPGNQSGSAPR